MEYVYTSSSISNGQFDLHRYTAGGGSCLEYIDYSLNKLTINQ